MRRWRVTLQDKMRHIKYLKSRHKNVILKLKCHFTLIKMSFYINYRVIGFKQIILLLVSMG